MSDNQSPLKQEFPDLWKLLLIPDPEVLTLDANDLAKFTDRAGDLEDAEGLRLAISGWDLLLQAIPEDGSLNYRAAILYNSSNAHASFGDYLRLHGQFEPALREWRIQRELLFKLFSLEADLDVRLESACRCNYGNCLSHVGRTAEAAYHWWTAVQLDPCNIPALVAYGQGCERLIGSFPRHWKVLSNEAYLSFKLALQTETKSQAYFLDSVKEEAEKGLKRLLDTEGKVGTTEADIQDRIEYSDDHHANYVAPQFVRWISAEGLLLTIAPRPIHCPSTARDEAYPESLGTRTHQEFMRLAALLNSVKEDYSLARYLLYQYLRDSKTLVRYSALTDYATAPATHEFGLRPALVKSVVRTTIDALDRLSKVVEVLLLLPDDNKSLPTSFNNVWYVKKKRREGIRPEFQPFLQFGNPVLGLLDIHQSWDLEDGPLKSLRDLFVHDVGAVTGYARLLKVARPGQGSEEELDLLALATESLRMLRSAFLLVCQIANGLPEHSGEKGKEMKFTLGRSLSDLIDLDEYPNDEQAQGSDALPVSLSSSPAPTP